LISKEGIEDEDVETKEVKRPLKKRNVVGGMGRSEGDTSSSLHP
jgi:hypothetical protein